METCKIFQSLKTTTASYEVQQDALLSLWKAFRKNHVLQILPNGWKPCEEQNMTWNHFLEVVPATVEQYWSDLSDARSSRPIDRLDDRRFERWKDDFMLQAMEFEMECDYVADKLGVLDEHKSIFQKRWNQVQNIQYKKDDRLHEARHRKALWELWRELEQTYQNKGESKLFDGQRKALWYNFSNGESPQLRQYFASQMGSSDWTPTDVKLANNQRRWVMDELFTIHVAMRSIQLEEILSELSICDKERRAYYEKVWASARDGHPANQRR